MTDEARPVFNSSSAYEPARIRAAAIYCSDGRLGNHFDEFLQQGLSLPRYDRLVVPGGPVSLVSHYSTYQEGEMLMSHLRFLVDVHGLKRVVLVAHENCAFYTERLQAHATELHVRQREDLEHALRRLTARFPTLDVEAYMACFHESSIAFNLIAGREAQRV